MEKMSVLIAPADSTLTFNSNHLIESPDHELYAVSAQPSRLLTSWPEPRDSRIVIIFCSLCRLSCHIGTMLGSLSREIRVKTQDLIYRIFPKSSDLYVLIQYLS